MGIEIAIGTIVAASIAAGHAVAAAAAAAPVLFTIGAVSAAAGIATGITTGVMSHKSAELQKSQLSLQAQAERTQASIEANNRQRQLARVLASQNAIFGGSNIDMGSGTPSLLAEASFDSAQRDQGYATLYSQTRLSLLDGQMAQADLQGTAGMIKGFSQAGQSLLSFGTGIAQMGHVPGGGGIVNDPFKVGKVSGGASYTQGIA